MKDKDIIINKTASEHPMSEIFEMHTHSSCEILAFLEGDACFSVEGNIYNLHPGDLMLMRRFESHCLIPLSDKIYKRFTVHFNQEILKSTDQELSVLDFLYKRPLGMNNRINCAEAYGSNWLFYLNRIYENRTDNAGKLTYLLPLLYEINKAFAETNKTDDGHIQNKTQEIIQYINKNIFNELSLDILCENFFISKSQLNRIFRQNTGSTVWNYITVKRLYEAKNCLRNGIKPTEVSERCGFNDYITFYKAYKKEFGKNPQADYRIL